MIDKKISSSTLKKQIKFSRIITMFKHLQMRWVLLLMKTYSFSLWVDLMD